MRRSIVVAKNCAGWPPSGQAAFGAGVIALLLDWACMRPALTAN
ncbi:MAG TPA: hypothetical protein VN114_09755 [Oxalicibacterium sp.]|nr:hypothetical protein [Oxalicibacterium sp.]HWU98785.1 hypothetical protein [Oxalicibacterium sp.]